MCEYQSGKIYLVRCGTEIPAYDLPAIKVWKSEDIYTPIGAGKEVTAGWISKYGVSSFDDKGIPIAPDFPILSLGVWMNIDVTTISGSQISELIEECTRALKLATTDTQREIFTKIAEMAEYALSHNFDLAFGHP